MSLDEVEVLVIRRVGEAQVGVGVRIVEVGPTTDSSTSQGSVLSKKRSRYRRVCSTRRLRLSRTYSTTASALSTEALEDQLRLGG